MNIRIVVIFIVLLGLSLLGLGHYYSTAGPTMPTKLDINGINWRVESVKDINQTNLVGLTDCAVRVIYISSKSVRPRVTLAHEVLHATVCLGPDNNFAVDNMYFNSTSNEEHEGIYRDSAMWAELMVRNPDLSKYLSNQ